MLFSLELIIHAVADRDRLAGGARRLAPAELAAFADNLVDYVAGGLAAPISRPGRSD
jgi:hypothetical protein